MYAAVLNDPETKGPLLLFSADGGMDIEELAATRPDSLLRLPIDIRTGLERERAEGRIAIDATLRAKQADRGL